jgi:hypothetical protein
MSRRSAAFAWSAPRRVRDVLRPGLRRAGQSLHPGDELRVAQEGLCATIRAFFQRGLVEAVLCLPWTSQNMRGEIFSSCNVFDESNAKAN